MTTRPGNGPEHRSQRDPGPRARRKGSVPRAVLAAARVAVACAVLTGLARPLRADPTPDLSAATQAIAAALDSVAKARIAALAAVPDTAARRLDYLWVVRFSLADSGLVERAVERAHEIGVRGLIAQVVGRGDAFYRSAMLPRAESLAGSEFDPLGLLVRRAHAKGLEVHAWVNCMLVWSLPHHPRDPRHVVNAHPEWVARLEDGRPMSGLSARQRRRLGVEGVFLSPAFPGVRAWLGSIVKEIVEQYAVDGVHLDYIRLPGIALAGDAGAGGVTEARTTEAAVDGETARADAPPSRAGLAPRRVRQPRTDDERARVAEAVGEVRDSLWRARPGLPLSAAVVADTAVAAGINAQHWTEWLRRGLIDRAFTMCYAPPLRTVVAQLMTYARLPGLMERVVPGIAVYNTPPGAAAAKIQAARSLGFRELALYSYDALERRPAYWPQLRDGIDGVRPGARADGPGGAR